jgi:hypothetical protein
MICIDWIPNITGNIFLSSPLKETLDDNNYESIDGYKDKIERNRLNEISKFGFSLVQRFAVSDIANSEPWMFVYLFQYRSDLAPKEILVFSTSTPIFSYLATVSVLSVDKRGLVKTDLKEVSEKIVDNFGAARERIIKETFFAIRDLYREISSFNIVFGDNDERLDSWTLPSFQSDEDKAVKEIFIQYYIANIQYNRSICMFLSNIYSNRGKSEEKLLLLKAMIQQAKECLMYNINLLTLYPAAFSDDENNIYQKNLSNISEKIKNYENEVNNSFQLLNSTRMRLLGTNQFVLAIMIVLLSTTSFFFQQWQGTSFFSNDQILIITSGILLIVIISLSVVFLNNK